MDDVDTDADADADAATDADADAEAAARAAKEATGADEREPLLPPLPLPPPRRCLLARAAFAPPLLDTLEAFEADRWDIRAKRSSFDAAAGAVAGCLDPFLSCCALLWFDALGCGLIAWCACDSKARRQTDDGSACILAQSKANAPNKLWRQGGTPIE